MVDHITYVKGTSKSDKASFQVGKEKLPAAVVTRLLNSIDGLSGAKLDRAFYQALAKYAKVLDILDALGVTPTHAIEQFQAIQVANKPAKPEGAKRATKVERVAETVAKVLCKKFKGSGAEIIEEFQQVMRKPEFRAKVLETIDGFEKMYGKNTQGFIKTSARKGNPAAQNALAEARAGKKIR